MSLPWRLPSRSFICFSICISPYFFDSWTCLTVFAYENCRKTFLDSKGTNLSLVFLFVSSFQSEFKSLALLHLFRRL